jgi:hypothetical protein
MVLGIQFTYSDSGTLILTDSEYMFPEKIRNSECIKDQQKQANRTKSIEMQ